MLTELIETEAHTTRDGMLNLSFNVGVSDADVNVTVHVRPVVSAKGIATSWPVGYFERLAGSMPELERPEQSDYDVRLSLP
ncbi:MAG: hypothetical protein WCT04_09490 [Planctomycetota bacterium]